MSENQSSKFLPADASNLTRWRVYSALFGLSIGAWLGTAFLFVLNIPFEQATSLLDAVAVAFGAFGLALLGLPIAFPIAALVLLCGIPFAWDARITLVKVLTITGMVVGMLLIAEWISKGGSGLHALKVLLASEASSALCWRITKNWHSPEPDVDCTVPKNERDATSAASPSG